MAKKSKWIAEFAIGLIERIQKPMDRALRASQRFEGLHSIYQLADDASKILSIGNHTGEGWFLTGEMIDLLKSDVTNIRLHAAFWLFAKSCGRQGCDQRTAAPIS